MLFIYIFVIIFVIYVIKNKIHFDIPSFFRKTKTLDIGVFGVYCFTGHQGSGKTYALNKFIRKRCKGKPIYSNITLKGIKYTHLYTIDELYALADKKDCIIIYDEIFSLMDKSHKDKVMLKQFLPQMRKVHNIFLTTAQYWLELDMTFRRFVRIQIECETRPLGLLGGILKETYFDATKMKWSQLDNEYIAPLITTKFSKYEARFMESYDTYERVKALLQ